MASFKLLAANAGSVIVVRLVGNILSLVTLPAFISYFGEAKYGVFVLAIAVLRSSNIFDFGVNASLIRYSAEYRVDNDRGKFSQALVASVVSSTLVAASIAVALWFFAPLSPSVFGVEPSLAAETEAVFRLSSIFTFAILVGRIPQSVLEGNQLFYLQSLNQLTVIMATLAAFILVKTNAIEFVQFAVLIFAGHIIPIALNTLVIVKKKLLNGVSLRRALDSDSSWLEMIQFSGNLFLLKLIALFSFEADKFILGGLLSSAAVTTYIVITKPMFMIRMMSNQALKVVSPLVAELSRRGEMEELARTIRLGSLALGILVLPMVALVAILIQDFIDLWIAGGFSEFAFWGAIAALGFLFVPIYAVAVKALTYTGHVSTVRKIDFWTVLLNVGVSIVATKMIGVAGVIVGSLFQLALKVPLFLYFSQKKLGLTLGSMVSNLYWRHFLFVGLMALLVNLAVTRVDVLSWFEFVAVLVPATICLYSFGLWVLFRNRKILGNLTIGSSKAGN